MNVIVLNLIALNTTIRATTDGTNISHGLVVRLSWRLGDLVVRWSWRLGGLVVRWCQLLGGLGCKTRLGECGRIL